jgi:predicted enzyme related to lactoylglutathione lyase
VTGDYLLIGSERKHSGSGSQVVPDAASDRIQEVDMTNVTTQDAAPDRTGFYTPGAFVWHVLLSHDPTKAEQFYSALFGWTVKSIAIPGVAYSQFHLGDRQIGGMYDARTLPASDGITPHWQGYISVTDVDKAASAAVAAGGEIVDGPLDIPNVGRLAVLHDAQGAMVSVFKDAKCDPDSTDLPMISNFCWDTLQTTDIEAAAAFYAPVIGWNMVSRGPETGMFKFGDLHEAAVRVAAPGVPPHWLAYIGVADLDAATLKAETLGATIVVANHPINDWGKLTVIQDPVGAFVALFQGMESE